MARLQHTRYLGGSERLLRFLDGSHELFIEPQFASFANDWHSNWPTSMWFDANPWRDRSRYVRFHYLRRSRELPSSARDDAEILKRYSQILGALMDGEAHVSVLMEGFSWTTSVPGRRARLYPGLRRIVPSAEWIGVRRDINDGPYEWTHVWKTSVSIGDDRTTALFQAVTSMNVRPLFMTQGARRLFRPYEGGVDVLVESQETRDSLLTRFPDWLSPLREWDARPDEEPLAPEVPA